MLCLLDVLSCKTNEYHLPGFCIQSFHRFLGRLLSKDDEFYLPKAKATGLKAPDIRLSLVVCLQKQSLSRVGHTSDLSVRKLYVARPHGAFHGSARAYLRSSLRHDRPFKD